MSRSHARRRSQCSSFLSCARAGLLWPLFGYLFLACNGARWALAGACVGMRALTAHRQPTAVPKAAITAEIHQPLDVHRHLAAQIAFHKIIAIDGLADLDHFRLGEIADPA